MEGVQVLECRQEKELEAIEVYEGGGWWDCSNPSYIFSEISETSYLAVTVMTLDTFLNRSYSYVYRM